MTLASNIAAAWTNIATVAAGCTLTASSEAAGMLVSKLQNEHTRRNWRSGATSTVSITGTYPTDQSADTVDLLNTNLTAGGLARVRFTSAGGVGGDVWDSNAGLATGQVDPSYKDAIVLASSVKSGWRSFTIDLVDASRSYIEAGFLFIGTRTQFAYNYSYGAGRTRVDPSITKKTNGGQTVVRLKPAFWQWEIPMGWITEVQTNGVVEQIDLLNGRHLPVLFLMNPASTNLGKDSIFGLIQDSSPVVSIQSFDSAGGVMSSKTYKVEQRL